MRIGFHRDAASWPARSACRWSLLVAMIFSAGLVWQFSSVSRTAFAQLDPPRMRGIDQNTNYDPFLAEKLAQPGDLTLRKTALPEALFAIGELWGLNLVVGEEIQGQVNCDFQNAPLREILNTVLLSNGYSYRPFGRSLVIVRMADMGDVNPLFETATIPVRYGDPVDLLEGASVFNSPRGKTKAIPSARSLLVVDYPDRVALIRDFVQGLNQSSNSNATDSAGGELQTLQLQPQFVPALMMKDALGAVLSKEGKVIVIDGENRVVVVDYPYFLRLARQVMEHVDRPRPQVRITAYIYDVGLQDYETLGLNWSNTLKGNPVTNGTPNSSWAIDSLTKVPFADGAVGGAMTFFNMSEHFDLRATINALNTCKDSRLLADPNVVVVDNETATVAIVSEIPFQQLTQTQQGGNIGTTAFREAGVKLNVLPRIAEDGTIQMVVEPEFSRLTGFTPESQQPIIDRRTAKTTVRVMNGQTLVIGGLRQRTDVGTFNGIPLLKDIPYLGILFRSRETDVRESELIVFIQPEIVNYAEALRCRESAALGTSHKYLDQIPMGQAPIFPLPLVEPAQSLPAPGQKCEEIPAPAARQKPLTVEEHSKALAYTAQRGSGANDPASRPAWSPAETATRPAQPSTNSGSRPVVNAAPGASNATKVQRLPPVFEPTRAAPQYAPASQSVPAPNVSPGPATSAVSHSIGFSGGPATSTGSPTDSDSLGEFQTTAQSPLLLVPSFNARYNTFDPPAATESSSLAPLAESSFGAEPFPPATRTEPEAPPASNEPLRDGATNPLRTRGYRVNESDEIRSATWVNNVFRF